MCRMRWKACLRFSLPLTALMLTAYERDFERCLGVLWLFVLVTMEIEL